MFKLTLIVILAVGAKSDMTLERADQILTAWINLGDTNYMYQSSTDPLVKRHCNSINETADLEKFLAERYADKKPILEYITNINLKQIASSLTIFCNGISGNQAIKLYGMLNFRTLEVQALRENYQHSMLAVVKNGTTMKVADVACYYNRLMDDMSDLLSINKDFLLSLMGSIFEKWNLFLTTNAIKPADRCKWVLASFSNGYQTTSTLLLLFDALKALL